MIGHDFPYLDTKDLNLDWLLKNMKKLIQDWATYQSEMNQSFSDLNDAFVALKSWVETYFEELDVQQEINNKIDSMIESGELEEILQPIISSEVADWLAEHITNPSSPPVDTSLSVAGAAADAKAVGDNLAIIKSEIGEIEANADWVSGRAIWNDGSYETVAFFSTRSYNVADIVGSEIEIKTVLGWRANNCFYDENGTALTSTNPTDNLGDNELHTYLISVPDKAVELRVTCATSDIGQFSVRVNNLLQYLGLFLRGTSVFQKQINAANYSTALSDLDNADDNTFYLFNFSTGTAEASLPAHMPVYPYEGGIETLLSIRNRDNSNPYQLFFSRYGIYYRYYTGAAWVAWSGIGKNTVDELKNSFTYIGTSIDASNYQSKLSNLDNAGTNTFYLINFSTGTAEASLPAHMPVYPYEGGVSTLTTYVISGNPLKYQVFTSRYGIYYRYYTGAAWVNWETVGRSRTITVGSSGSDFTKLTDAIEEAKKYKNTTVFVKEGTYDLITEKGSSYWENTVFDGSIGSRGIELTNGIRLIFASKAKVTMNYTGSNETVNRYVSPFNISGNAYIENLYLECKNVRYCVHDERGGITEACKSEYQNCYMSIDNSDNAIWPSMQCIGGGLGVSDEVIVNNSFFTAENTGDEYRANGNVSWHNNSAAGSKSRIIVTGCYMESTFRLSWYGASTEITQALVSNNSFGLAPVHRAENEDATVENTELLAWNNVVRS